MAVTDCKLADDFDYAMTTDHRGRSTYAMRWIAKTDTIMPSGLVAIGAQATDQGFTNPLPARWSSHSHLGYSDPFAYLKGGLRLYMPRPHESKHLWHIDGIYEPLDPGQRPEHGDVDPLARPPRYRLESESYSRVLARDRLGNPIVNGAGQEFTDRPEEEGFRDVLLAVKNVRNLLAVTSLNNQYRYSVNTDTFHGAPPRHARIDNIESSDEITEGNTRYYEAIIRVVFSHEPWDKSYLNQGFMVKDVAGPSGKLGRAVDFEGKETPEPVLLKQDGTRLAEGAVGNFNTFRVRREVPYAGLGI